MTSKVRIIVGLMTLSFVAGLVANGVAAESKCAAAKVKAAGKKAAAKANCHAKALQKDLPVDAACLSKAEAKFDASFAKADEKNDNCPNTGDAAAVEITVDDFLAELLDQVTTPPTTTTTLPAPTCTDLIHNGAETDIDCGGGTCPQCGAGDGCLVNGDCGGIGLCFGGICL
jgi:hypothetical protein